MEGAAPQKHLRRVPAWCKRYYYQLQKCLGLETCDAGWRIMRRPQLLAQHDKFLSFEVLPIVHDKLRFCMTKKRGSWVTCMTDFGVMLAEHDRPSILPDPDIFTFDNY